MRPRLFAPLFALLATLLLASSALAFECTNVSKNSPMDGAQLLFGSEGEILWVSTGLANRLERGLIDPDSGEGFHGIIAFDIDGDGVADASTFIGVGPDGEIPLEAQFRGPACRGLTNLGIYFTQCLSG